MPDLSKKVREINSAKTTQKKITAVKPPTRRGRPPKTASATKVKDDTQTIPPQTILVTSPDAEAIDKAFSKLNSAKHNDWVELERSINLIFHIEWMIIGVFALVLIFKLIFGA